MVWGFGYIACPVGRGGGILRAQLKKDYQPLRRREEGAGWELRVLN
jgi:hypothetical protein